MECTGTPASMAALHVLRSSSQVTITTPGPPGVRGIVDMTSPPEHLMMSAIWSLSGLILEVRKILYPDNTLATWALSWDLTEKSSLLGLCTTVHEAVYLACILW